MPRRINSSAAPEPRTVGPDPRPDQRDSGRCACCGRTTRLTFHHLIPRKMHRRSRFRRSHSRAELQRGIRVCRPCHSGIHRTHDEMRLALDFNTLEALRADPALARHFAWVARQRVAPPR